QWQSITDITREEINKLEKLLLESKFDEDTASKVRNIIDQFYIWQDAMNKMREEITGTSFSSLLNNTKTLFADNGADSADAWGKSFSKITDCYIMNKFSREYLEEALQDCYT